MQPTMRDDTLKPGWSNADAQALYAMDNWSDGFYSVNEQGHVAVCPTSDPALRIDIMDVIRAARAEGAGLECVAARLRAHL